MLRGPGGVRRSNPWKGASGPVPQTRQDAERQLAVIRVCLSAAALVALLADGPETLHHPLAIRIVLSGYLLYSAGLLALLRGGRRCSRRFSVAVHAADLAFAAGLMTVSEGPSSPFFVFVVFVLLAAAYRWTMVATVATALVAIGMLVAQGFAARVGWIAVDAEWLGVIVRSAHLLMLAAIVGYLSTAEKIARADASAVNRLTELASATGGLLRALERVVAEVLRLFGSRRLLLVLEDREADRLFLLDWQISSGLSLQYTELPSSARPVYLFDVPADEWWLPPALSGAASEEARVSILDPTGSGLRRVTMARPAALEARYGYGTIAGAVTHRAILHGRIFIFDPSTAMGRERTLRLLQSITRYVGAQLHNVYLLRRLGRTAGARERARVARDLHDGSIQTLIGINMKVDVLRRQAATFSEAVAAELSRIQALLREEIQGLRELIHRLRPVDVGPAELTDHLEELVERFGRECGISTRFTHESAAITAPQQTCSEIVLMVREALVNVRRHAGATQVTVRLGVTPDHLSLAIEDNGRGFPFSGRLADAQSDRSFKTPATIRERVASLGGNFAIESTPGRGSRLEITIPRTAHD
jgi:signal transduction histidine kinase